MKLSYKKLSDKIANLFKNNKDLSTWQNDLTKLIEKSGWSREEWDSEVHKRYE
jgi:hypothetical protein